MAKKKTWLEKFNYPDEPKVKRTDKAFAGIPSGSNMLIPTPLLIDNYLKEIGYGKHIDIKTLRKDLALEHKADFTCPLTTGIFLRIVAEANYEQLQNGTSVDHITPFWRVIDPNSPLAKKLSFGQDFLIQQIKNELDSIPGKEI